MGTSHLLDDEHFVEVDRYPLYEVSNFGRVVNVRSGKDLLIRVAKGGDRYVVLYSSTYGNPVQIPVRVLVAQAFFAAYRPSREVFLKSQDQSDCSVMNITLVPPRKAGQKPAKRHIRIVELDETFATPSEVAKRINGESGIISKVLFGMGKTHRGYHFEYIN